MFTPLAPFLDPKTIHRNRARAARSEAAKMQPMAAVHAAAHFMDSFGDLSGKVISLYHPLKDELDPGPLLERLSETGAVTVLPVVARRRAPLLFRRYAPGDPLGADAHGVAAPLAGAEELRPDIMVVPLLAFDGGGGRLGYGGGYYDRTLAALRGEGGVVAVGYAYAGQEVAFTPTGKHDQPVDWIVTEQGARRF